jgi:hypothetical protein
MALEVADTVSFGAQGDDIARVQQALRALGRGIPLSESEAHILGPGTSALVRALQQELDLTPTGTVDGATLRAINVLREKLATDTRMVRGPVRDANSNPLSNGFVQVFHWAPEWSRWSEFEPSRRGRIESRIGFQRIAAGSWRSSATPAQGPDGMVRHRRREA